MSTPLALISRVTKSINWVRSTSDEGSTSSQQEFHYIFACKCMRGCIAIWKVKTQLFNLWNVSEQIRGSRRCRHSTDDRVLSQSPFHFLGLMPSCYCFPNQTFKHTNCNKQCSKKQGNFIQTRNILMIVNSKLAKERRWRSGQEPYGRGRLMWPGHIRHLGM